MVEENDGIEEAIEGQIRLLVTTAGQMGERFARARQDAMRRAEARSLQEARELGARFEAEKKAAHVQLAQVYKSEFWDKATPDQIGNTYQTARSWAQEDPDAARAEQHMRDQVRARYGVEVTGADTDPQAVREAVERAEKERTAADAERNRAATEKAEADRLMREADQEDQRGDQARQAAEHEPDPAERDRATADAAQHEAAGDQAREQGRSTYDSAERREATASELRSKGVDSGHVETRMRADVSQGTPAAEATKGAAKGKTAKARKSRGRGAQVQHAGPGR